MPKPNPSFSGCWHCGKKHPGGRRQCPEFRALLAKNGGKLPDNYEGAYEKALKEKGGHVNLLHWAKLDADAVAQEGAPPSAETVAAVVPQLEDEHAETDR